MRISIGIDLTSKEKNRSGFCVFFEDGKVIFENVYRNSEIIKLCKKYNPNIISIDAPLTKPLYSKKFRKCDLELIKLGFKPLPLNIKEISRLNKRGINIKKILESKFKVIECFPRCLIEKKFKFYFFEKINKDDRDALACAIIGLMFLDNKFIEVGDEKEGKIILPNFDLI